MRMAITDIVAVTADLQYIDEDHEGSSGVQGWIPGVRVTAEF